jgi:membrane-bound lytic murein transglycosylase A
MKLGRSFLILISLTIVLAGCAHRGSRYAVTPEEALSPVGTAEIDFADDLDVDSLDLAIELSIHYYDGVARNNVYRMSDRFFSAAQMKESLLAFRQIIKDGGSLADKKKQINEKFAIYRAAGSVDNGGVLFTGYYAPLLEGSLTRTDKYRYPIYKAPPELIVGKNTISYSRKEIDEGGVLRGKNLELVWVADPVELFFLHIQGSGEIKLDNGIILTVGTMQSNGRPYRSLARYMLDKGIISSRDASNRNIKRFLKEKSDEELYELLSCNERYIFFHFVEKPTGSLGLPVTPGRTIATDPDMFPEGALAFIRLSKPVLDSEGNIKERVNFSRFVLNQDKGSAIKGPGRVDLFCGFGKDAETVAGTLKEKGELYFLIKK